MKAAVRFFGNQSASNKKNPGRPLVENSYARALRESENTNE